MTPKFSIVVATFNRPVELQACLRSLAQLDYPAARFEVIVVDDGSPVPVPDSVGEFAPHLRVSIVRQANRGCGPARNLGARAATGEYLVFADDDCLPRPDCLTRLEACIASRPGCMAGGRCVNSLPHNPYSEASQMLMDFLLDRANAGPGAAGYLNNIAIPREPFLAMGCFDENLWQAAEDRDLCDRWRLGGGTIVFEPAIIIGHAHQLNWSRFWRQHYRYGCGAYHYRRKALFAPSGSSFYLQLFVSPFRQSSRRPMLSCLLLLAAQAATLAGYLSEWRKCE